MMFDGLPLEARELNFRESIQVGTQYIALQDEAGECALTKDFDQASRLQLFNMMRELRSAHALDFLQLGARRRFVARPDLLENLNPSRFGQNSANSRKLRVCQSSIVGYCHRSKVVRHN